MISKLSRSIVYKNGILPFMMLTDIKFMNLKLTHMFSYQKKNPFDKFKRNNHVKKTSEKKQNIEGKKQDIEGKKQNIEGKKLHENEGEKYQTNSKNQSQKQQKKLNLNGNVNQQKPITGFNKFKRSTDYESKLKITLKDQHKQSKKQQKQSENQQKMSENKENQKQKQLNKNNKNNTVEQIKQTKKQPKITENINIKGFNKFKKVETENKKESTLQKKEQKTEHILNNKSENEDDQRENAYKNTDKKIQQDKEEWQKFYQEQIKKEKEKKQPNQHKPYSQWKNFDFTNKQKDQQNNSHKEQKANLNNENGFFKGPWTPTKVMRLIFFGGMGLYLGSSFVQQLFSYDNSKTIQTQQLIKLLKQGQIRQTWFQTNVQSLSEESNRTKKYAYITLQNGLILKSQSNNDFEIEWNKMIDQYNIDASLFGAQVIIKKVPIIKKDSHIFNTVRSVLSFALLFMFFRSIMSGLNKGKGKMGKGGLSGMFQNSKSHRFRQNINVKFVDVVGMNKAKEEIVEFIDFLKNAEKYNRLGAKIPRGALLTGPPGTGKTMLAKACAGESGVPFFTISGSEFMQMYVGVGAQRVRNLFAQAKQAAPSIIFIDEIDAVGKKRSSGAGGGGNDQRDNTLNQLLVEMDGFDQKSNVIIFAATNQKQVLDPALTRPGRFDRLIQVDLPDIEGRRQIFMVHLKPIVLDQKYKVEDYARRLATLTPGFSGADIKNLCNQAAIIAARNDKTSVSMIDFELASERIIGGVEKKSTLITPETKRTVAYHECGHGVVSWFMQHASPLLKLTIIPRSKGALGYAQYLPNENQVYTRQQLEDQICVILGGRISEQIFFGKISTGASDDLQKAHKVAKAIIAEYGMGDTLGWLSYGQTEYAKEYSHATQQRIDEQIMSMIKQCSIRTRQIITKKKDLIEKLAELLLKVQTIDQRMIQGILGQRPFKSSKQYEQYIREREKLDQDKEQNKKQKLQLPENLSAFSQINNKAQNQKISILY